MAILDAHQLRDLRVVRGRPEGAAQRRAVEQKLQAADDGHGDDELDHRKHADREIRRELPARHLDRPGIEPAAVVREQDEQYILDDDRQAERHQQWRQLVAQREVQQSALQRVAEDRDGRHDDDQRRERTDAERLHGEIRHIGRDHDEIAVRDVDQAHDAKDERQTCGKQRIKPAEQNTLDDDVDQLHASLHSEIGGFDRFAAEAA